MNQASLRLTLNSLTDLPSAAQEIVAFAGSARILLFYGEMGAGKTTLITRLCKVLGVKEDVSSPTFSIVNQYRGKESDIYHFDFYRLKNQNEALDMGYEEYFYSDAWCLVEWPEKINGLLPQHYVKVRISATGQSSREIIVQHI
ncbi:tRNA (adenosine(37)-N6)-threonylcarbamoyltransferase complex ATPase subunit type 1 TsaE [Mucilaginibacter ginkgonis]|uniref:tRNA threonylcarbamoyladenosine biosynthesis protein TsaE n=1 Tax=Mucilaginibacter ginkgonis TaxID=2682091 RepID=A0A6I4HZS6_9SPHI|nr:tRNA (adenosine(37)-N6)-threonylcarbamoyltransferase complex ATPase subunit type 1 TsaE [Mucilaginibacter ginkgonis]QQL48845.1 tRNA (adenosine(37)-N6)-threonylcarbamoyltransferase complex ATPase subunit type 1 TsaE [Mucilaginibacter ginkgonis]